MSARRRCQMLLVGTLLAAPGAARGGGPLVVATDGAPVRWDTGTPIPYHTDRGSLGALANAEAVALMDGLFATWAGVPTTSIRFARTATMTADVDATNFGPLLGPYGGARVPRRENAVVFDADGSIFDALFGVGTGVVGFAGPLFFSDGTTTVPIGDPVPPGARIIEGMVFLNGKWIDGVDDPASRDFEITLPRFAAVCLHELGHFSGLDHTQIHGLSGPPESDAIGLTTPIETMFPFAVDETQSTLGRDDVVAISMLYPSPAFAGSTGRITGRVLTSAGAPLSGVNVVARNVADDGDAVSYVSGATLVRPGEFTLGGLLPGASYTVEIQPVDAFHTGGSGVGPFSPPVVVPGPPEFYNGAAESADPATDDPRARTPIAAAAGVTVSGVDVVLNRQLLAVSNVPLEPGSQPNGFAVADFDRDLITDFVATQFGFDPGNVIRFFRGRGGGAFTAPEMVASFPGNAHIVSGQLNLGTDDFLDIAVASESLKEVRVYLGDGTGHFGLPRVVIQAPRAGTVLWDLAIGDLNGDVYPDLATLVEQSDGSAVAYGMLGSASGMFNVITTALGAGSGFPRGALHIARFVGTRVGDLIGIASSGGAAYGPPAVGILIGDGLGRFSPVGVPLAQITNAIALSALAVGDFDEDGALDLALSDLYPTDGPNNWTRSFVDVLLGDGTGALLLASRYAIPESSQESIVTADLDGDGHLDLASTGAWFGPGRPGAKVTLAYGDGAGGIRDVATIWGLAEFPTQLAAADLDGDGRTDLLVNDGQSSAFGLAPMPAYSVLLNAFPSTTTTTLPAAPTTVEVRVGASGDDAEEKQSGGSVALTSSDLELVDDGAIQVVGLRFAGVAIPPGARIVRAWVQFKVDERNTEATSLAIRGQAADSAPTFTTAARNVSGRTRTTAAVVWQPGPWTVIGEVGLAERTPDVGPVIQEIVDRPGWASGNALGLVITGTGHRTAKSFDGDRAGAPLLHIECEAGNTPPPSVTTSSTTSTTSTTRTTSTATVVTSTSTTTTVTVPAAPTMVEVRVGASGDDAEEKQSGGSVALTSSDLELVDDGAIQVVGLRFAGVAIPPGARIVRAWVQFKVDERNTEATSLAIRGQAADSAPTFTTAARNVSGRTRTTAAVVWQPGPWTVIGEVGLAERTPDVGPVIQEIVGRPGWASGNALGLVITGTGHRTAKSFDGDRAGAPLLHVEF